LARITWESGLQQRCQLAATIERVEIVAAAHMDIADEDLRHRRAPGALDHLAATLRLLVEIDDPGAGDAARGEQRLGALAERAPGRAVDDDGLHRATGSPACCHACSPPTRLNTCSRPARFSWRAARAERLPLAQQSSTGRLAGSSPMRFSRSGSGMLRALGR